MNPATAINLIQDQSIIIHPRVIFAYMDVLVVSVRYARFRFEIGFLKTDPPVWT
jgi:hypothetical protein